MSVKLKIRESLYILKGKENIYTVLFTSNRLIKIFKVDCLTKYLIANLCKGEITEKELINKAVKEGFANSDIRLCIRALKEHGIVYQTQKLRFSKSYIERFKRQLTFLSELAESQEELFEMQNKIKNAVVTVFEHG